MYLYVSCVFFVFKFIKEKSLILQGVVLLRGHRLVFIAHEMSS